MIDWFLFLRMLSDAPRGWKADGLEIGFFADNLTYFLLVSFTIFYIFFGRWRAYLNNISKSFLAIFLYQSLSLLMITYSYGFEGLIAGLYIQLVLVSFYIVYFYFKNMIIISHKFIISLHKSLVWLLYINSCVALYQLVFYSGRIINGFSRSYGLTSSPNMLSVFGLILFIYFWENKLIAKWRHAYLFLSTFCVISSFSITGLFLFFLYLIYLYSGLGVKPTRLFILIILSIVALYLFSSTDIFQARISEFDQTDNSLTWRIFVWESYLTNLSNPLNFLFGNGLAFDKLGMPDDPHNEYLRIMTEIGLVGLILYLNFLSAGLYISYKIKSDFYMKKIVLIVFCVLIAWSFLDSVLRTAPVVYLYFAFKGCWDGYVKKNHLSQQKVC